MNENASNNAYAYGNWEVIYACGVISLTALEGFVVGDADVLEHVGVAGEHRCGDHEEPDDGEAGAEEKGGEFELLHQSHVSRNDGF